ncbi:ABC transporter ATP-binding protein [Paenibacillus sp.]|uniref:ABC transporter ATP-binding protein n=1 Tax=Paenibacillus sp. TaxID=58172 RepID=UPI002D52C8E6|nr:ABC transporter ATP-binding protein [Paenibacillus sp.]HZG57085.1 ABC transporter ATP-binding protein [Paenibacillus sp.]
MAERLQEEILRAENVTRIFGHGDEAVYALRNANLSVARGRLIALKGRSGSGKTTLLNLLATLDAPSAGRILYEGRDVGAMTEAEKDALRRTDISLIFQSFGLVPYMSAYENVEFSQRIAEVAASRRRENALRALEFVGLTSRMHHRPQEMSGGEQQRTAIARAIAHRPKLLLADEPTAELDTKTGFQMIKMFRDLVEKEGMSVVMTTHDPAIMDVVDLVYALEDGEIVGQSE